MTREQLNKHWEVMEAYKNGAEVEYYFRGEWTDVLKPEFCEHREYRIKPSPKYVPFTFEDAEFLIGKVVKSKNSRCVCMIIGCNKPYLYSGDTCYSYMELFDEFTFLDGSPCGKVKV